MPAIEYHIFGPPGTGKTTWLMRHIESNLEIFSPNEILVASFTRAAAKELVARGVPLPESHVGTLHSMCYHALDRPELAETKLKVWNGLHPQYAMNLRSAVDVNDPASYTEGMGGNKFMADMQRLRARMVPVEDWPEELQEFYHHWKLWLFEDNLTDFTGLIERGIAEVKEPPFLQAVGYFDEAQDFTTLEMALVRSWAQQMEAIYLVGDDDQAIYGFKGGDASAFIDFKIAEENKHFLTRSYRLPSEIVRYSQEWVRQIEHRQEKDYDANTDGGEVIYSPLSVAQPDQIVGLAQDYLEQGKSVMMLSTCAYMLEDVVSFAKEKGVMLRNPFRPERRDWTPIKLTGNEKSSAMRLRSLYMSGPRADIRAARDGASFGAVYDCGLEPCPFEGRDCPLFPLWSISEFLDFAHILKPSLYLRRGGKKALNSLKEPEDVNYKYQNPVETWCKTWAKPERFCTFLHALNELDHDTVASYVGVQSVKPLAYVFQMLRKLGLRAFNDDTPALCVGTIHSVKGGEADVVILAPDISPASFTAMQSSQAGHDDIIRQMYVGMTRAKETLVLLSPISGTPSVRWV